VSSFLAQARTRALRPISSLPRPRLTVVAKAANKAPRIPFVVLVVTLLVGGLVGLLLLNTALQRGAYATTALRDQAAALEQRHEQLEVEVDAMAEPQRLARRAQQLGMVADASPGFLQLSTGRIVGDPTAGKHSGRIDVAGASTRAPSRSAKIAALAAGEANGLTSGPVVVPDPTKSQATSGGQGSHGGQQSGQPGTDPNIQYGGEDGSHR
jgi:hypothetical protein